MNEWFYVGLIVLGILTIQSNEVFTWQHFGLLAIIFGGFLLAHQEIEINVKTNTRGKS